MLGYNGTLQAGESYSWLDWLRNLSEGFFEGAGHGAQIAINEYSFGGTDYLGWTRGSELVDYYGTTGKWSRGFARLSRDAAIAAVGTKAFEISTRSISTGWRVASGADKGSCLYMRYTSRISGRTIRLTQHA